MGYGLEIEDLKNWSNEKLPIMKEEDTALKILTKILQTQNGAVLIKDKEHIKGIITLEKIKELTKEIQKLDVIENKEDEVREFVNRMINIAKQKGINLETQEDRIIKQAKNIPFDSKTSMQIDFEKNNPTELDNITGYLKDNFIYL